VSEREPLAADTVAALGRARGLDWSADEAQAIADQLESIRRGLAASQAKLGLDREPAMDFEPAP
jgi:hypothetical protein